MSTSPADRSRSAGPRPQVAPPPAGRVRVRMTLAYDGSRFHGMAANEGVLTVAGVVTEVLERVLGHEVALQVAGRTDKGVHASGQVVSFDADTERLDTEALGRAVNAAWAPSVVAREVRIAPTDFDARFSALARCYRYTVLARPLPDPFLAPTTWWVPQPLDLNALRLGCDPLLGSHDFSSFCRRPKGNPDASSVRRVLDARWHDLGEGLLRFDIEAGAFCHQMVRSIVGTLVEMGRGARRAGEMSAILAARDRARAGRPAPPQGLDLWHVRYPPATT